LREGLEINESVSVAYPLEEELWLFWKQRNKAEAEIFLHHWLVKAEISKIPMLGKFAKTLRAHKFGLLGFYDYRISAGPLEGH
jgi:transposase